MGTLDPTLRCNNCGGRVRDENLAECPRCRSDLAEVGVSSELREWGSVRQRGRARYVWGRWVLFSGGLTATLGLANLAFNGPWFLYVLLVAVILIVHYWLGRVAWASAEREYAAALSADPTMRSTRPLDR